MGMKRTRRYRIKNTRCRIAYIVCNYLSKIYMCVYLHKLSLERNRHCCGENLGGWEIGVEE